MNELTKIDKDKINSVKAYSFSLTWTPLHTLFMIISLIAWIVICIKLKLTLSLWVAYFCYMCAVDLVVFSIAHFLNKFVKCATNHFSKAR